MMNSKVMMMAALAVCGCARMEEGTAQRGGEMVELNFKVPCQKTTKVIGSVSEDAVDDLQIFVFGVDGQIHAYGHSEADQLTLTCSTGDKRIAALVNAPLADTVSHESSLRTLVSKFSDNALDRFVMSGIKDETIESTGTVTVPVSRLVSKVVLSSVTNEFELEQHREMDFTVKSVFLTNAAEDRQYFGAYSPSRWYNKGVSDMSQIISNAGDMMYQALDSGKIGYGTSWQPGCFLYCYPNPLSPDGTDPTYLVVEATIGTTVYYYPVDLPSMESNKCYNVNLTVCRPGSATPDVPVEKSDIVFKVVVQPWSENVAVDEFI